MKYFEKSTKGEEFRKKTHSFLMLLFFTLSGITLTWASSDGVNTQQTKYEEIMSDLDALYLEKTEIEGKIVLKEAEKGYNQCKLAHAKKEVGMEISSDSDYCF